MFTTLILKYATSFINLFALSIVVIHFAIGMLLLVFAENRPVKMILLIARGIYYVVAAITTFVMIGEGVTVYAWVGAATLVLVLVYAVLRVSLNDWPAVTSKRGGRSNASSTRAGASRRRWPNLANSQNEHQPPTGVPDR
ncbi:MAG TPA: hypothetical protein VLX61_01455 [Anaerolineales bacterium]|nr:hypothetical protein [Anaerolineales bacterium]